MSLAPAPPATADQVAALFARYPSPIGRDLARLLAEVLTAGALSPLDAAPALLALAELTGDHAIRDVAIDRMAALGFPEEQITEAREGAALVELVNTYRASAEGADPAALGLAALDRPALGRLRFTMLAFAVSVAAGDRAGIEAHGEALRAAGASARQLDDLARLAAVVKAASRLP